MHVTEKISPDADSCAVHFHNETLNGFDTETYYLELA